jgi:hypothetical protein
MQSLLLNLWTIASQLPHADVKDADGSDAPHRTWTASAVMFARCYWIRWIDAATDARVV